VVWLDPNRRLWCFFGQSYRWWDGRGGVWAITTDEPDSATPRWSKPRRLADGLMMNKPTVLASGAWLLPIDRWNLPPNEGLTKDSPKYVPESRLSWDESKALTNVTQSTDGGKTFEMLGTLRVSDVRHAEHMIIERRNGNLWMLIRTDSGISETISSDHGKTWSPAVQSTIPHVASRFFIRRIASGKLLLLKHIPRLDTRWLNPQQIKAPGFHPRGGVGRERSHLTAYLSDDDGESWYGGLLLDDRLEVSYPDADEDKEGRLFMVYDYNRKSDQEILMATVTEADVAAGKVIDGQSRLRMRVSKGGMK
jgi:predicted neuraminidase